MFKLFYEGGGTMSRLDELKETLKTIDPNKKEIIFSLLKDFVFLEEQIIELRKYPRFIINPANPRQQKKLPVHEMLKDYQAQKNDIATKILRTLDGEVGEESALIKALEKFNHD